VEELAVTTEPRRQSQDSLRRDPEESRDLTVAGAGDQEMKDGSKEVAALEPVSGLKGLGAEIPTAGDATETLDDPRRGLAGEGSVPDESP